MGKVSECEISKLCRYDAILCTLVIECTRLGFVPRKMGHGGREEEPGMPWSDIKINCRDLEQIMFNIIKSKAIVEGGAKSACDELIRLLTDHESMSRIR